MTWRLYDSLIDGIPQELTATEIICGAGCTFVACELGAGFGAYRENDTRLPMYQKDMMGAPLWELAQCVKSWNMIEAGLGLAAINAYYNAPSTAEKNGVPLTASGRSEDRIYDPFIMSQNAIRGKKVAVVGHFPHLERLFEPVCELSIIEWSPEELGDYPLSAAEYLLPACEYIYITSTAIADKTMPRLLELSQNAKRVTVVGPGTPMSPAMFKFGADELSGFVIRDERRARRIACGAENVKLFASGQKASLSREGHAASTKSDKG